MSKTEFENFWAWQMEAMQKKENLEFGPLDYYLLEIFEDAPFFLFRDYYLFVCYFSWTLLCVCKQQTGRRRTATRRVGKILVVVSGKTVSEILKIHTFLISIFNPLFNKITNKFKL